ncbi:hypothetical protein B0H17DRAFT_1212617 [Mycena rosella]|uniref:Uncharacterized protein n=1 Tax=Mycena rosella TaxID=1033263 RepID=A0AAD7G620_MYCRO|nr:hypothetical protein B0H17DRAFT_1212617 [Mycena rosella]
MHSVPVIHACILSYLYYGLKWFNMHTVVKIIPLLLHASLLFFAGLVAFLVPINLSMTALLAIVAAVYSLLTLLPLWHLDLVETVMQAMSHRTMVASSARIVRDYRALVWTVKSLADDTEFEPLVDAIPDACPMQTTQAERHIEITLRGS